MLHRSRNGGLLWTRWWTFGFYKRRRIFWLAEWLLASQEGFCSTELVSTLLVFIWPVPYYNWLLKLWIHLDILLKTPWMGDRANVRLLQIQIQCSESHHENINQAAEVINSRDITTLADAKTTGFESRQGLGIFLFATASRTALRPTQPPLQWVPRALCLG